MSDLLYSFFTVVSSALALYVYYRVFKMFWDENEKHQQSMREEERHKAFRELFPDAKGAESPVAEENRHLSDSVIYAARGLDRDVTNTDEVTFAPLFEVPAPMKTEWKLTTKTPTKAEWKKMIQEGMSVSAMAKATGIHRSSVYRHIEKMGLKTKNDSPEGPKKLDKKIAQNIIDDVAAGVLTKTEIAKKYGVHRNTIGMIVNRRGKS